MVEMYPDACAISFNDEKISYRELQTMALRLAGYLISTGIKKEDLVAIYMDRSAAYIVSMIGILYAGAAYVPLEKHTPYIRTDYILKDAGVRIVISDEKVEFNGARTIEYEDAMKQNTTCALPHISSSNLAYTIYTSGTTGDPKGVLTEHGAVVSLIKELTKNHYILSGSNRNIVTLSSFAFDASAEGIYFSLMNGHCLNIVPEVIVKDGIELVDYIYKNNIAFVECVPAHIEIINSAMDSFDGKMKIEILVSGGEKLTCKCVQEFIKRCDDYIPAIYNTYGPTECCIEATIYKIDIDEIYKLKNVPIGKPIKGSEIYLLDDHAKPVDVGEIGEIYISGDRISRGYIGETENRAFTNIWIKEKKRFQRAYKTGDYAKLSSKGLYEFIGRKDSQVKIRGYRVELWEIEKALMNFHGVTNAVVILKTDNDIKTIVAFYTSKNNVDQREIQTYLESKLPYYMIPQRMIRLDAFKLLSNNKIDMKALYSYCIEEKETLYEINKEEVNIINILKKIVGSCDINMDKTIYEICRDSIVMMKFIRALGECKNYRFTFMDIIKYPTIQKLAKYIEDIQDKEK